MLTKLAGARCAAVAGNIAEWALAWIGGAEHYDRDGVVEFFDARLPETRQAALAWLRPGSPGYDDPQIWARLIETPFDNVRLALIDLLERRARLPGAGADRLAPVWCAVLLGVHRGGRQKPKAVHQLAGAIADDPSRAERLAPLLAVAVRSIRGPEHRAGLAAVVELLERRPELLPLIRGLLPELNVVASEAPAA